MHFEVPKTPLRTLKEFGGHYLMIVISIITALALEHWTVNMHHASVAREAAKQVQEEIHMNLAAIRDARKSNAARLVLFREMSARLQQDIKAKLPDKAINDYVQAQVKHEFVMNVQWPQLQREAWEVAVANQSAGWMKPEVLRRYSAVYAAQRETQGMMMQSLSLAINGPRTIDLSTDLDLGAVAPRDLLHALRQIIVMIDQAQNKLAALEGLLTEASGKALS